MLALILWTWRAATLLQGIAAGAMVRKRLQFAFPCLFGYLLVSIAQSLLLMSVGPVERMAVYSFTAPLMMLLRGLLVIEVFHQVTLAYPNFRRFGSLLLGVFAAAGVTASMLLHFSLTPELPHLLNGAVVVERDAMLAMVVVLGLVRMFLRATSVIPVSGAASRAVAILGLQSAGELLIYSAVLAVGLQQYWISGFAPPALGLVSSFLWAGWFCRADATEPKPLPEYRIEEIRAEARGGRRADAIIDGVRMVLQAMKQ